MPGSLEGQMRWAGLVTKPSLRRLELLTVGTVNEGNLKEDARGWADRQFPRQPWRALSLVGDDARQLTSKGQS